MNYYIQGDAANADKIKAAFENKGFKFLTGSPSADKCNYHYTFMTKKGFHHHHNDNLVYCLPRGEWEAQVILNHPGYTELPLSVEHKFKVHDWVVDGDRVAIIYDLQKNGYVGHDVNRRDFVCGYSDESRLHLWTIQDAKDGDVLATDNGWTCIFKAFDGCVFSSYCFMDSQNWFCEFGSEAHTPDSRLNGNIHPATKEQRDLLFKKMKEAGYTWDGEKKELNKIQTHYDISNFQPKQWVLVRQGDGCAWRLDIFSNLKEGAVCQFECVGNSMVQCIPFDGNENLLGTTDMCDEMYINW